MSLVLTLNVGTRWALELRPDAASSNRAVAAQTASDMWPLDARLAQLSSLYWSYASLQDATGTLGGRSLASIERALRLDRHEPRSALEHARILWFTGGSGASVDSAFAEAFSHYPAYPLARAEYALYLAQSGRADESLTNLEIARLASDSDQERLAAIAAAEKALAADSE